VIVTCPYCAEELEVPPAFAGRPVRCGSCQAVFTPPSFEAAAAAETPDADSDPDDRTRPDPQADSPASAAGVWGVILLTLIVTVPCTIGCVWAVAMFGFPQFRTVSDDFGQYKALFPGDPEPINRKSDAGRLIRGHELQRIFPPEFYFVYYVDLPKAMARDADALLAQETADLSEYLPPGVTETGRETTTHDGYPATDVMFRNPDPQASTVIVRCVLVSRPGAVPRLYVVGIAGPVSPHDTRVKRFFTGFRLAPKK
jgi:hypothetical protein